MVEYLTYSCVGLWYGYHYHKFRSFSWKSGDDYLKLKAASIDLEFYIGDENLNSLSKLKSKNELIGELRSGSYNPMFKQAIGIAMIKKPYFRPSQEFKVNINGKNVSGKVCDLPFI